LDSESSRSYADRVVVFRAAIYRTGVHGMFVTDVTDESLAIPIAAGGRATPIPGMDQLIRLFAANRSGPWRVIGFVKGVARYSSDGSLLLEVYEFSDLRGE
jgi:hypothetical protein